MSENLIDEAKRLEEDTSTVYFSCFLIFEYKCITYWKISNFQNAFKGEIL